MGSGIVSKHPGDQEAAELYKLLIRNLTDFAIFMMDPKGIITTWSAGVERNLGYKEDEFIGQPVSMIFRPEDVAAGEAEHEQERAKKEGRSPDERWHRKKDGTDLFVDGVLVALRDEAGTLLGYAKIMRDATDRKLAEQALEKSNRDLTQFAYVVSHDLQAPLRAISIYSDLLNSGMAATDAERQEYATFINQGVQQMRSLIQDLLSYAQISADAAEVKEIDLTDVLERAVANYRPLVEESGAVVTHAQLPAVKGGETHLLQLFQNLIGNALKYRGAEAPRIHVGADRNGREWKISVQDNGIGMDAKSTLKIFEPFKRLHGGEIPGSGMGLAICKRIVEQYGGRIWVESQPGCGSTFYFTLPAK